MTNNRLPKLLTKALGCALLLQGTLSFAADEVRLMYTQFTPHFENGSDHSELEGSIEIKDIGPNKTVELRYQKDDGSWANHPAFYAGPTFGEYEAWKFRLPLAGSVSSTAFAIKYSVNGNSYWDNNNQQNYEFDVANQAYFPLIKVAMDDASRAYGRIRVAARLHDIPGDKNVDVVFSQDNWVTQQRLPMTFTGNYTGEHQSQRWNIETAIDQRESLEFYVEYTVGSHTYKDNNHGRNYLLNQNFNVLGQGRFLQRYDQVLFRGEPNGWSAINMPLIDDYLRSITIYFDGLTDFKYDIYGDWSLSFGDNNNDGIADPNGNNLKVNSVGSIRLQFNELTKEYSIDPM